LAKTTRRFLHVIIDQQRLVIANDKLILMQRTLKTISQRVNAGRSPVAERRRVAIAHARAEMELEHAEHELATSRLKLSTLWGETEPAFAKSQAVLFDLPKVEHFSALAELLQRNPDIARSELGVAPNVVRGPLDFTDDSSRATTFMALENKTKSGPVMQRSLDLTLIPNALLVTGGSTGARENYLALVARTALAWPMGAGKQQFLLGAEIGYAPNTHMASAVKLPGSDDVKGYAWQTSLNLMEFAPGQSVALVWGEAQAGWLISPDFRENERLVELRHRFVFTKQLSMESRIRQRQELEQLTTAIRKRDARDLYMRLSYKFK